MSDIAIKVENLGKLYRLGEVGTGTLSHDLNRWVAKIRGKEDPFAKIGEANDRTKRGNSDYVWALRDVNFDVKQGEVLGIIGRNGAGKSTLLKLLSKVTKPTVGRMKVKGRIASLLEVGTGFHPEMTGRENIFLNGAILGMTKREIRSKFDAILDFAGVERYVDTPVKRYSSGMYVRLAFAVAAHLEPEILIVDEVLAVGDAEFQKKCLGKMKDVSVNDGRTVLFVSHNMGAVKRLCTNGLLLKNGTLSAHGAIDEIIEKYNVYDDESAVKRAQFQNSGKGPITIHEASIHAVEKGDDSPFDVTDELYLRIAYSVTEDVTGTNISVVLNRDGLVLFRTWDIDNQESLFKFREKGDYVACVPFPVSLSVGRYSLSIDCGRPGIGPFEKHEDCLIFDVENNTIDGAHKSYTRGGLIKTNIKWKIQKVK